MTRKPTKYEVVLGCVVVCTLPLGLHTLGHWATEPALSCYDVASGVSDYIACLHMDAAVMWADVKQGLIKDGVW